MKMVLIKTRQIEGVKLFCKVLDFPEGTFASKIVSDYLSLIEYDDTNWKLEEYIDMLLKVDEGSCQHGRCLL